MDTNKDTCKDQNWEKEDILAHKNEDDPVVGVET